MVDGRGFGRARPLFRTTSEVAMPAVSLPRENDLGRIVHSDPLRVGGRELTLIDDPVADRIADGDPTLGWSGDDRLALYLDTVGRQWVLFRLEHDSHYRAVASCNVETVPVVDLVPKLILRLVEHDTRRGFRPDEHVNAVNAAVERELERQRVEHTEEFAHRLRHALIKDGVDE